MKKIIAVCLALATIVSTQAQRKKIDDERYPILTERSKLSDEQRERIRKLNEQFRRNRMDLNRRHLEDMRGLIGREPMDRLQRIRRERRMGGFNQQRMQRFGPRFDQGNDQMFRMRRQPGLMRERMQNMRENNLFNNMRRRGELRMRMERRRENLRSFRMDEQMRRMPEMKQQIPHKRRVLS